MNDNFWVLPAVLTAALVIFFLLVGLIMMGSKMENERIYEKCLTTNSSMVYNDVTKMCKDIVK